MPARVVRAEEFYAARGAVVRVQITPGVCPPGLDALLTERGYRAERPGVVAGGLICADQASAVDGAVAGRCGRSPDASLVRRLARVNGGDPQPARDMLTRLERPCGYARVAIGDEVVAVGRAVVDDGWAGVFGMATLPRARCGGAGRSVLVAWARWAEDHGADSMFLQVERDNLPALRLYEKAGFTEVCGYHYRTAG